MRKQGGRPSSSSSSRCNYYSLEFSKHILCPYLVVYFVHFLTIFGGGVANALLQEKVCRGFDIRNEPAKLYAEDRGTGTKAEWENCTVVEGDVRLVMITQENASPENFRTFPTIREITGYLMVFQVRSLDSIGRIFPNLKVIGGKNLVMNFALVIYQNPDLRQIGLTSLAEISNGGVSIVENDFLCSTDMVNWTAITRNKDVFIDIEKNRNPDECMVTCDPINLPKEYCERRKTGDDAIACWNATHCQARCTWPSGCYDRNKSCHDECAGGCTGPTDSDCYACRHVFHGGRCVSACPEDRFLINGRRCLTESECRAASTSDHHFKPINRNCVLECPPNHEEDKNDSSRCQPCQGACLKRCTATDPIAVIEDARALENCNIITNNLLISIPSSGSGGTGVGILMEKYFGSIEEVEGYVEILFTPALFSLGILKNLKVIHGKELRQSQFSLFVVENENLAKLFPANKTLKILNGQVQFRNNPKLCPQDIIELTEEAGMTLNQDEKEAVRKSNGLKTICDERNLDVNITRIQDSSVELSWKDFDISSYVDQRQFMGFQVYYKAISNLNEEVDMFKYRDACNDSWKMQLVPSTKRSAKLEGLKPYTAYAFYVKTLIVHHLNAKGAISPIQKFVTLFSIPSEVRQKRVEVLSSSSIKLEWKPPEEPNGVIGYYKIEYHAKLDTIAEDRDYCVNPPAYGSRSVKSQDSDDSSSSSTAMDGTCPSIGCCECKAQNFTSIIAPKQPTQTSVINEEKIRFRVRYENTIQNIVLPPHNPTGTKRRKRSIDAEKNDTSSRISEVEGLKDEVNGFTKPSDAVTIHHNKDDSRAVISQSVTSTTVIVEGLKHFTMYQFRIWACQNASHEENYCSIKPLIIKSRTMQIEEKDAIGKPEIGNSSLVERKEYWLHWKQPSDPNGRVVSYRIEYESVSSKHPTPICVNRNQYMKFGGYNLTSLPPGNYSLKIRAVSLAMEGPWSETVYLYIPSPPLLTTTAIILICALVPLFILVVGVALYFTYKRHMNKRLQFAVAKYISTNPEYISMPDVYKQDEWELKRDDIELLQEIGHGTFGNVYAGRGKNVTSYCGLVFGDCAVKTVRENASDWQRLKFLCEASDMKRFNTAFIVKLYGVVSEGQPALMVMELMEKGNLRDYLRSRRPGAEENVEGLPPPTLKESLLWALQIADGMAYLEAQKYCHRDLAARNCMVDKSDTCKIGDFGMARDVYVKEYYRPEGKRLMPVRWMAPESLKDAKFTCKSDVWSYGVVVWELATLSQQPYQGLGNEDILKFVVESRRVMDMPKDCPRRLYEIMRLCWRYEPKDRPTFRRLVEELIPDIDRQPLERFKEISFYCNPNENGSKSKESGEVSGSKSDGSSVPLVPKRKDPPTDFEDPLSGAFTETTSIESPSTRCIDISEIELNEAKAKRRNAPTTISSPKRSGKAVSSGETEAILPCDSNGSSVANGRVPSNVALA